MTKLQRLFMSLRKVNSMTHKQIVKYLLRGTDLDYNDRTRRYFDSDLYGKGGFFRRFCRKTEDNQWTLKDRYIVQTPVEFRG